MKTNLGIPRQKIDGLAMLSRRPRNPGRTVCPSARKIDGLAMLCTVGRRLADVVFAHLHSTPFSLSVSGWREGQEYEQRALLALHLDRLDKEQRRAIGAAIRSQIEFHRQMRNQKAA